MSIKILSVLYYLWKFFSPLFKSFMSDAGKILAISALKTVKVVAETMGDADGEGKRKVAFELILDDLEQQVSN